jgi:hypothetical protein
LFWAIYVLDRRWSFGIGMPFALNDLDIDPELPRLVSRPFPIDTIAYTNWFCQHDVEPYLDCMVSYGKLCSKVWYAVAGYGARDGDDDSVSYLDFQVQHWRQSISLDLQLHHTKLSADSGNQSQGLHLRRVLLYVRGNHMRIFVHRQNIVSASNILRNLSGARLVVDIAKDTIAVLVHLRETSPIYDKQQTAFNYFLVSAISAIFLAVCHAPAEFSNTCRTEFYRALGLLSDLSAHSYVSKRLWKSVQGLRHIASDLGLAPTGSLSYASARPQNFSSHNSSHEPYMPTSDHDLGLVYHNNTQVIPEADQLQGPGTRDDLESAGIIAHPTLNLELTSDSSLNSIPNMVQMNKELMTMFNALDQHVHEQRTNSVTAHSMGGGIKPWLNSGEISSLFECLI